MISTGCPLLHSHSDGDGLILELGKYNVDDDAMWTLVIMMLLLVRLKSITVHVIRHVLCVSV